MRSFKLLFLFLIFITNSRQSFSQDKQSKKIEDVVYGMVSGTALLMDVYVPVKSNHKAIILIPGSAWGFVYPGHYDQIPLKDDITIDNSYIGKCQRVLVQNGYTVFVINHRFTPKFQYRDIIEDCRRAVRYVRYHAKEYNVDPAKIGAMGQSSGANLASMLGVSDNKILNTKSPVDSVSSKVQAVVTLAAPFDLANFGKVEDSLMVNNFIFSVLAAYMGSLPELGRGDFVLSGKYAEASPISLVTPDDAATLIYCSDNDPIIPVRQAKEMFEKLTQNKVAAKIVEKHKEEHSPVPDMTEVCKWFEKYLH